MRRLVLTLAVLVAGALGVTEAAMQPTTRDRVALAVIYLVAAIGTVAVYLTVRRWSHRTRRLASLLQLVTIASVSVVAVTVVLAAQTMFLSDHDRNLVLVALFLGLGLGSALALALGDAAGHDISRLESFAAQVAGGEFEGAPMVERRDEIGSLAGSLARMADRLAATESERAVFLASVGHDLRTPLAAMRAQIEAFQDGVLEDPRRLADGLDRDVAHLSQLVEDLFLFARMEAGTLAYSPERVDLVELADETAEAMAPLAARRGVELQAVGSAPIPVEVDAWAIGRVLRNLVDNAIRHSPPGGRVRIEVESSRHAALVRVRDEGPGFDPGIRSVAFDEFTRGDAARRPEHGGSGLGLAIARGIVEAHRGVIDIEDAPGGCVVVSLPPAA
jgi:signal transduction histidine kinase